MKGEPYGKLAEGVPTVKALVGLGKEYGVDLPICRTVYEIVYRKADPMEDLQKLFARSVKGEFDQ